MIALVCCVMLSLNQGRIDGVAGWIDIDKYRCGTAKSNGSRGGYGGVGNRDHFIAWTDIKRFEGEQQRIRSRGDADGMRRLAISGKFLFELTHFLAKDVPAGGKDVGYGRVDLRFLCQVSGL